MLTAAANEGKRQTNDDANDVLRYEKRINGEEESTFTFKNLIKKLLAGKKNSYDAENLAGLGDEIGQIENFKKNKHEILHNNSKKEKTKKSRPKRAANKSLYHPNATIAYKVSSQQEATELVFLQTNISSDKSSMYLKNE